MKFKFRLLLSSGVGIALVLCFQCVRTYLYTETILIPQQAEHEAVRQVGALSAVARSAFVSDPRALTMHIERAIESASDRVMWMRLVDEDRNVLAQGGRPQGTVQFPPRWHEKVERHETPGATMDTLAGKAFVIMLPFRLPGPHHINGKEPAIPPMDGHSPYVLEVAVSLRTIAGAFAELRQNLIVGLIASLALLASIAVIGLRAQHYARGQYLENELRLAKTVQSHLQPEAHAGSPHVEFVASALAADHVGGDFYDVFETESGKVVIVLGDVSGKGVPAALLGSMLQGAIRSSTTSELEPACERIHRMLCERTACERFATLFWGVFDPVTGTLRYLNAGHTAPALMHEENHRIEQLSEGGPALGLLPNVRHSAATVNIYDRDTLVLYSDGISEAVNQSDEEFGDSRIQTILREYPRAHPNLICERIMSSVTAFATSAEPADDRTLLVIRFPQTQSIPVSAVA